jgi:hypothetical protein
MTINEIAAAVVLAAAAMVGAREIIRALRGSARKVDDLGELISMTADIRNLVQRELNHNHGSSMKDDSHGTAISVRVAHERIDQLDDTLRLLAEANNLVLPIIADAINASPPQERTRL